MECIITAFGTPTATFGWSKNGYKIALNTTISNSSLVLTMKNVSTEDNGVYNCVARNVLTYQYDHIELTVTQPTPILEGKDLFDHNTVLMQLLFHIAFTCIIIQYHR